MTNLLRERVLCVRRPPAVPSVFVHVCNRVGEVTSELCKALGFAAGRRKQLTQYLHIVTIETVPSVRMPRLSKRRIASDLVTAATQQRRSRQRQARPKDSLANREQAKHGTSGCETHHSWIAPCQDDRAERDVHPEAGKTRSSPHNIQRGLPTLTFRSRGRPSGSRWISGQRGGPSREALDCR